MSTLAIPSRQLEGPYPPKGAQDGLKQRIVAYLRQKDHYAGTRLPTEAELSARSGLSVSTIRRTLAEMQQEGWVRREVGRGTFVGPRACSRSYTPNRRNAMASSDAGDALRLAVIVLWNNAAISDWYSPSVLRGIDAEISSTQSSVELLGDSGNEIDLLSARLSRSRPDVVICLAGSPSQAFAVRDAHRIGIPVLGSGTGWREFGLPSVCEDNAQAVRLAYEHLVENGHTRIGLLLTMSSYPFIFERLRAFSGCCEAYGGFDSGSVHWINAGGAACDIAPEADRLPGYLDRYQPTAVISGSAAADRVLGLATLRHHIGIPDQLSLVSFDQSPQVSSWLGLASPTTIRIPLEEMGRELARLSQQLHHGHAIKPPGALPCSLEPGDSVAMCGDRPSPCPRSASCLQRNVAARRTR